MASCTDCGIGRIASGANKGAFYLQGSSSQSWSNTCDIGTANGLHCDPLTGNAWVAPPVGANGVDAIFGDNFAPGSNVAPLTASAIRSMTFNNPSQCLPFVGYLSFYFNYGLTFNSQFEMDMIHLLSFAVNGAAGAPAVYDTHVVQGNVNGVNRTIWDSHVLQDFFSPTIIPPGGFVEAKAQIGLGQLRAIGFPTWVTGGSQIVIKFSGTNTQI